MKRHLFLLAGLMAVSPFALAMDAEYVVMGGFSTIVNAFTRVKLIFNDNQYASMVTAFVVMGMLSALLLKSAKGGYEYLETGKAQMGMGWLGLTMLGTIVYFGLVQPKGTIHIYDQSRNQYQAVSGIPDFLILTAGVTNQAYQAFVDMSNRNTATTTRFTGEGTPIKMLLGILNRNGAQFDPYLTANVKAMWNQCSPVAETRGFDPRSLKSGSSVLDVVSALAPLRNQAVYTSWVSPSNPQGATVTCDQAYVSLKSDLGNPAAYGARIADICTKNGYTSGNATQLAECKSRMENGLQTIFGASGLSLNTAMSNVLVSQAITDAMLQNNPDVATTMLTNRAMINGGMADAITNPEWLSFIMAGVIAIILSVTPLLLLLVFTPLMGKALTLLFGLWIFITSWQIADALLLQAGTDEILTAMNDLKSMGLGIDAVQMGPSSTMKAMSVMASARETALQIAMLIAGLFGVSAYGLSAFGQKAMSRLDRVTEETSDKAFTPEGKGAQIDAMNRGHATLQTAADIGNIELMSSATSFNQSSAIESGLTQISALGGTPGVAAQRSGAVEGGRASGTTRGYENGNTGGGFLAASETSMVQAQSSIGEAQGIQHAASASNMSVTEQSELSSGVSHTMQTADAQSNLKNGGGQLSTLSDQQGKLHSTERETQLGHAAGTRQAASATGKSVTDFTKEKTATSAINEHASGQGQLQASGGTLGGLHSRSQYTAAAESDERQGRADALHNAYDAEGGIASGVSESQTEHLTQNLHDMREQKANIQEISKATGATESQSREILSAARSAEQMGTLEGNNFSPKQMQENSAWSTSKGANIIQGEKAAFAERDVAMPEYARRHGETEMHQAISGQDKFDTLSDALKGDKPAADALAGANTTLAINQNDARNLEDSGLINQTQADAVPDNGVGTVHMSMRDTPDGKNASTSTVKTGSSTVSDDSFTNNSEQTFGSAPSAQQNLQHAPAIERFVASAERTNAGSSSRLLGAEIAKSLSPFISQSGDGRTQQAIDGGASVGKSGFLREVGKAVGVDLSAGVNMSNINGRATTTDQIAAAAGHKIQQFRDSATEEADAAHLSGRDREEFINQNVALKSEAFYRPLLKAAQETAEAHSTGSIVSDISTPQTKQATPEKSESGFTRGGISSPMEYAARKQMETESAQPQHAGYVPQHQEQQQPAASERTNPSGKTLVEQSPVTEAQQSGTLPSARQDAVISETTAPALPTPGAEPSPAAQQVMVNESAQYQGPQPSPLPSQPALSGGSRNGPAEAAKPNEAADESTHSSSAHPPVASGNSDSGIPLQTMTGGNNKNIPR
ncbi:MULTISPECIES: conjugal transfer protein TraG N-terminal domain-containing protein [Enterobacter cloacae complex]|uniref:conjugal transfer protein TraG N-terminal domain-containing protein n=1 Tax=Enterobacter cloacae complex TaxID=354276 RepID=UPI0022EFFAC9|nr:MULTISPECIES: conjugal transfer protein TraG N-terminal domain-containing protein [Enterobacter cloacae complex]MDA4736889.1 conjugal transfer protein TraG N-terminal domain-containing protein [Enterobacter kobei]MDA4743159.1 conjugal transfer protein TraG N-terminal domain-containing protein [Enterobacter hormaechei]